MDPEKVAPYGRLGRWVDTLGFRGRFTSSSRAFSTTLGALRDARRTYKRDIASTTPRLAGDLAAGDFDRTALRTSR